MTDLVHDVPTVDETHDIQDAAPAQGSILSRLAARRAELAAGRSPLDLEIPGYSGELWCRYRFVEYERVAKIATKLEKVKDEATRNLLACQDTLITCCEEILVRDKNGGLVSLAGELGDGKPVRFDLRLAEVLAFDAENARDVVRGVFENDFALIGQAAEVTTWLGTESPEVDAELLGEA